MTKIKQSMGTFNENISQINRLPQSMCNSLQVPNVIHSSLTQEVNQYNWSCVLKKVHSSDFTSDMLL